MRALATLVAALLIALGSEAVARVANDCGGARPCGCGDRVVDDYQLTADLGPCPEHGLRLGRRVRFDGAGHAIVGTGTKGSFGLQVSAGASGSFVQNVTVRGFERGVRLSGASNVELNRIVAHGNGHFESREGYGVDFSSGATGNRITQAKVFGNADEGVHFGSHARANRITRSEVYDNGRENVYVLDGVENVVEDCTLRGAGNAAAYIKHSKATMLIGNKIYDRPVVVRGASSGTRLIDNTLDGSGIVFQPYVDKKLGRTTPVHTLVRGGRISNDGVCVRVDGAEESILEDVELACTAGLELGGGGDVGLLDAKLGEVRCVGEGEVRQLRRVDVHFVDGEGQPVADVRLGAATPGMTGPATANRAGVFIGSLVESIRACPRLVPKPAGPVHLAWPMGVTSRAVGDLAGRVVLTPSGEGGAP